ncbi:MAG: hypothetical protein V4736_04520 [Bdellovibrionota bacterium]
MIKKLVSFLISFTFAQTSFAQIVDDFKQFAIPKNLEEFHQLKAKSNRQSFAYELLCESQKITSQTPLIDVFEDPNLLGQFRADPVLRKINTLLYFNDSAENLPEALVPEFIIYAKNFFILYKNNLVASPEIILDIKHTWALQEHGLENRPVIFNRPNDGTLLQSYLYVTNNNRSFKDITETSFSAVMMQIMSTIAQYPDYCGVAPEENAALAIYIGMGFVKLNSYLRKQQPGSQEKLDLLEKLTNQALEKIQNTQAFVFRTTTFLNQPDMPEKIYRQHRVGETVLYDAFTSTSTLDFSNANLVILSKTGKRLFNLSVEGEVLFRSHTQFKVHYNSCETEKLETWQGCKMVLEEVTN